MIWHTVTKFNIFYSSYRKIVQNTVQKIEFISNTKYIEFLLLVIFMS